jgi:signal transduction histidine kinase
VRDRGGGIPEGDQSRVFDRFFTTEREHGGTGLGLSIVQAVARARGGSVTFDSGPRGTTFRVVL